MSGCRRLAVCITLVIGLCPACSTVRSLSSDDPTTPKIYGGVRLHLKDQSEADSGAKQLGGKILAAIFDLPFSAIFDTLLLPVTVFLEPDSPEEIKRKSERERHCLHPCARVPLDPFSCNQGRSYSPEPTREWHGWACVYPRATEGLLEL